MNLTRLRKIYFLGIGGIGMSAIARYFLKQGVEIHGYDLANTELTKKLEAEGMHIHYDIDVEKIPKGIELVIYTPAIPEDHAEKIWFIRNDYELKKRAEVLGLLSRNMRTIAIAGTHGKTTTSCLTAHVLKYCGIDITAFLGGIMSGYDSNFLLGDSDILIAEADEYDRSFLHLYPECLAIMSMDADHLDIYENVEVMYRNYEELTLNVRDGGVIILGSEVEEYFSDSWRARLEKRNISVRKLGVDFKYDRIEIEQGCYRFDFVSGQSGIESIKSGMAGIHNIMNCSVALEIGSLYDLNHDCRKEAIETFRGIRRRFETVFKGDKVLIDDYAHHPEELKHAIETVNNLYRGKRILGIFQPHLFTRTKDFYEEFSRALEGLEEVWLLPVYPAREEPISGITSELIWNLIRKKKKKMVSSMSMVSELEKRDDIEVVITLGASDLDKHHNKLIEVLKK
ncbi:MAG: UDP-N-acetylmuramate--L-alanine ligase [Bacteroidia bacterium]|nr:UDP-N-acetylmuramate--L-alanine ligase [Bacteroidia bacterium]